MRDPWSACTWRYETLMVLQAKSKLGLVTLLQHGMEKGSTGMAGCWLHGDARWRSRPSEHYRETQ